MTDYRSQFLLDPEVTFLNHGSFGATPRAVFETYQYWQRQLELQPVQFITNRMPDLLAAARQSLGDLVNAAANDLVFVPNATIGVNIVANSLNLSPGDEVLSTDHEYGACANVWRHLSAKKGFRFIQQPIRHDGRLRPLSPTFVDQFWRGVTPNTKVIFISHITSPTAQLFPIGQICHRAAAEGIITVIDGAHAPGQIEIDLQALRADFYAGNCHKWLCAPKGSAFLYTREERQSLIEPLAVGWGWGDDRPFTFGSDYLDYLQWLGTDDIAAYLAVPAAVEFQAENDWPNVRKQCQTFAFETAQRISRLPAWIDGFTADSSSTNDNHYESLKSNPFLQMSIAPLPPTADLREAQNRFYQRYQIEVPFIQWHDKQLIRVSVQGYNTEADLDKLINALNDFYNSPSS